MKSNKSTIARNGHKAKNKPKTGLENCNNLIDILRHMSIASEQMKKSGNTTTAAIIDKYADRICLIHNRQAVFNDELKRILQTLRKDVDKVDAVISVLATYVESAVCTPFTLEQTDNISTFIKAIREYKGQD